MVFSPNPVVHGNCQRITQADAVPVRVLHQPAGAECIAMLWCLCSANQRAVDDGRLQHCAGSDASHLYHARGSGSCASGADSDAPHVRWASIGDWITCPCRSADWRAICADAPDGPPDFARWHIRPAGAPSHDCGTSRGRGGHGSRAPRRVRSRCQTVPSPSTPPAATRVAGESSSCSQL